VGDALGAAVEFLPIDEIRRRYGPAGVTEYHPAYGHPGAITDDTQMSLFTAEGLLRSWVRGASRGIMPAVASVVDNAYGRWLLTQGERGERFDDSIADGWLFGVPELHHRRAPGNTCIAALHAPRPGSVEEPLNDSKGCGGVMRIAPVGLGAHRFNAAPFELGCELAAITHGHPSGYLAAGALADIIAAIVLDEAPLAVALDGAEARLQKHRGHDETLEAVQAARSLAASSAPPSPETLAQLGGGWVAEEALAISVYCALVAKDFAAGVRLAVNHSGDSDSTGATTGNILGALYGYGAIPAEWVNALDVRDAVEALCRDWNTLFLSAAPPDVEEDATWLERYPPW
jgi:ADP-ribosylglycohydrolase